MTWISLWPIVLSTDDEGVAAANVSLRWNAVSRVSAALDLRWNAQQHAAGTSELRWNLPP